jgi:hypothetical protein
MEPDEDEDPTRLCAKCGTRPRWSRMGNCTTCVECGGRYVAKCISRRKQDGFRLLTPDEKRERRRVLRARARARARRLAGKAESTRIETLNVATTR